MEILFITHRFPHPPNRGDSIRSFHFLKRFAEMGKLHLAAFYEDEPSAESRQVLGQLCEEVHACPWGKKRKWLRAGRSLLCGRTMTEGLFFNRKMKKELRQLFSSRKFDRIVVFCSSMVQYLDLLKGTMNERTPVVVDLVDVDSQKWFDYSARSRGWKKLVFRLEGERLRKVEIGIASRCSAVLAVTPEEIAIYRSFFSEERLSGLTQLSGLTFRPLPNGVDMEYFNPAAAELAAVEEIPARLVFVGALDYRANVGGVEWFVENILPEVRKQIPNCEFDVVGSRPGQGLKHLAEVTPGMNLIGTVPDVRPYLKRAAAVVIPLQVARGLQNKVLEACAMQRPVIASRCAAEGIVGEPGKDLLVCDSPSEWISVLADLLQDEEKRRILCLKGRAMTEKNYGWSVQLDQLEALLRTPFETER